MPQYWERRSAGSPNAGLLCEEGRGELAYEDDMSIQDGKPMIFFAVGVEVVKVS